MVLGKLSFLKGDGLQAKVFRGSFLTGMNFAAQNVLRLASNLILTRLLFPEAFGLMTLVQVVLFGTSMFSDFGIRGSIIQDKRGEEPIFLNTAWTLQIGRGVVLGLIILGCSGLISDFYEEPQLEQLLWACALIPLIQGLNSTRLAVASRNLMLGRITLLGLGAQVAGILVMIALAWWMQSVWALMIGNVVGAVTLMVLSHLALPGAPNRPMFELEAAKRLFGFGKYVFLATLAAFFINQGDKAILGKFITLEQLAVYNIGYFLATVPQKFSNKLNDQIIFPLYARRPPKESAENRQRINKARFLLTAGLLGIALVLALIGVPLMNFLYDPRYEAAGPILVLIAIAIMPQMITLSYERLPLAMGHSGRYAGLMVGRAVIQLAFILIGIQMFGLGGAILAQSLATFVTYPFLIYMIRPYMGWDPRHDAVYLVVFCASLALIWWLSGSTFAPLFVPSAS